MRQVRPPLTVEQILAWADAHHASTGRWPHTKSGPVEGAPGEVWATIDSLLAWGRRGLPRGSTLTRLLHEHGRRPEGRRGAAMKLVGGDGRPEVKALREALEKVLPLLGGSLVGVSVSRRADYALFDFVKELMEACDAPPEAPAVLPLRG
jgi:hypothetical protein